MKPYELKQVALTLVAGLILGAVVPGADLLALDNWPVVRHDHGRSGHNPDVGSFRPPLAYLDTITLDDENPDSFQVLDVITGPQRIYAMGQFIIWGVDKATPTTQWHNDDCLLDGSDFCFNQYVAFSNDRLIVVRQNFLLSQADFGFELVVLNAATGQEIWSRNLGDAAPEIAMEGDQILALLENDLSEGRLLKLTLSGRQEFIKTAYREGFPGSRAVVAGGRFIYVNDDIVHAYNTSDGSEAWTYTPDLHADAQDYDLVATSDAVIVSQDDRVIKLSVSNGSFAWETDIKPSVCNSELRPNGAASDGQTIAVTAVCDEELVALDYVNGAEKWRENIGPVASSSALSMAGGVIYAASVATPTFNIFAFDPNSGAVLQQLELNIEDPEWDTSSVLPISDGLLLLGSDIGGEILTRFERTPADLSAELSGNTVPACGGVVGASLTFVFTVRNNGPGTTDNTRADLVLPAGALSLSATKGSCFEEPAPFCNLGPLGVGEEVEITATVVPSSPGIFEPGISLSGDVRDPDDSNDSDSLPLNVNAAPPPGLDIQTSDIEITQGLQNLDNAMPLVDGKQTFVRFYARTNSGQVGNVTAVLHGQRVGTGVDLGTLFPMAGNRCLTLDDDTPDRDRLSDSFVFAVPGNWSNGSVIFTAEVNPGGAIVETDPGNNTLDIERAFTVLPRICMMTYPVRTTGTRTGDTDPTDNLFPPASSIMNNFGNIRSRALTLLPTKRLVVFPNSHLIEEWEVFSYGPYEMEKEDDNRGDVLDTLWWLNLFTDDPDDCDADDSLTHYVGMVHQDTDDSVGSAGLGIRDGDELMLFLNTGPNGPRRFDDPHGGLTLAHEVGHNYDRGHVDCDDPKDPDANYPEDRDSCSFAAADIRGYYGLEFRDPTSPVVVTPFANSADPVDPLECPDPLQSDSDGDGVDDSCDNCPNKGNPGQEDANANGVGDLCEVGMAGDLMSYADDVWTSDYTWRAIQEKLCDANDCGLPALASRYGTQAAVEPPPPITGDVLVVRGLTSPTPGLRQAARLPVEDVPEANEIWPEQVAKRPIEVVYAVKLLDGADVILHSEPFSPKVAADASGSRHSFGLVIPWDPDTERIELTENDTVVDSMELSPSPPEVTAISPDGGEMIMGETLTVSWSASDPDGDDLLFIVQYSCDSGSTWHALVNGTGETSVSVDSSLLPGGDGQCLVKVIASDGLHSATRQSAGGFSMPDRSPGGVIFFPDHGDVYPVGSSIIAQGAVYDPEDGYLAAADLSWELSGFGALGSGEELTLPELPEGEYTLTLSAIDSNAQPGSAGVTFTVGPEAEFDSIPFAGSTLAFGDQVQQVESEARKVLVSNLGDANLLLGCQIGGADPGSFNLTSCFSPVIEGGSSEVTITCEPESVGQKTATLELTTNDMDEPVPSYFLSCTGVQGPPTQIIFRDGFED